MQTRHQAVRTHDDRPLWQPILSLIDTLQILPGRVRLSNSSGREVQNLVPVITDIGVQLCYSQMRPIASDGCKDVAKSIGSARVSYDPVSTNRQ
jgi:hypothetical protein